MGNDVQKELDEPKLGGSVAGDDCTNSKKVGGEQKGRRIVFRRTSMDFHAVMLSTLSNSARCGLGLDHGGETERDSLDARLQRAVGDMGVYRLLELVVSHVVQLCSRDSLGLCASPRLETSLIRWNQRR